MMFKEGDEVVRNTALSDSEVYDMVDSFEMYDRTKEELVNGFTFTVQHLFDNGKEVRVQTQRGTNVRMPIEVLMLKYNILNEGEEL